MTKNAILDSIYMNIDTEWILDACHHIGNIIEKNIIEYQAFLDDMPQDPKKRNKYIQEFFVKQE